MNDKRFHVDESAIWYRSESGWPEEVPKNLEVDSRDLYRVLAESCEKYAERRVI